jgi:hypothetical protein
MFNDEIRPLCPQQQGLKVRVILRVEHVLGLTKKDLCDRLRVMFLCHPLSILPVLVMDIPVTDNRERNKPSVATEHKYAATLTLILISNVIAEWLAPLLCICEVSGFILNTAACYKFSMVCLSHSRNLHFLSSSTFTVFIPFNSICNLKVSLNNLRTKQIFILM